MSVLIKGMEIPKSCIGCLFGSIESCDETEPLKICCTIRGVFTHEVDWHEVCPLVEAPKWIPVTERLPLLNTPVLATDGIEVDISWMYGVPPRWITNYTAIDEDKLTHWMPLPQTPKE